MALWWLSFADPDRRQGQQFLGVAIIRVPDTDDDEAGTKTGVTNALVRSHALKINPGGEVQFQKLNPSLEVFMPEEFVHKLLTKMDIKRLTDALRDMLQ
jgi:hypothetical protein